jgi:hypothetical protein
VVTPDVFHHPRAHRHIGYLRAGLNRHDDRGTDRRRVFDDLRAVEPLLRKAADYEVKTTMPLNEVVTAVLRLTGEWRGGQDAPVPFFLVVQCGGGGTIGIWGSSTMCPACRSRPGPYPLA